MKFFEGKLLKPEAGKCTRLLQTILLFFRPAFSDTRTESSNSALIRENAGQRKPIFWHNLLSEKQVRYLRVKAFLL